MVALEKQHILVVDDDPHIRQIVRMALTRAGYTVTEASDGLLALQLFDETQPDLVLLDVLMPELDGIEVCKKLRAASQVPILFLSSRDDEIDRILGLELGADDYISKPFSPRELVARIKAVLRRVSFNEVVSAQVASDEDEAKVLVYGALRVDLTRVQAYWGRGPGRPDAYRVWDSARTDGLPGKGLFARRVDGACVGAWHRGERANRGQPCAPVVRKIRGGRRRPDRDGARGRL